MAFDFYRAYLLTTEGFSPQIVLGLHKRPALIAEGDTHKVIYMLTTKGQRRIHYLDGKVVEEKGDHVEVVTKDAMFKLDPLTLSEWHQLGQKGLIGSFDDLKDSFKTDGELQQFYVQEFLMSVPWYEAWGRKGS